jgi:hypothetical protein
MDDRMFQAVAEHERAARAYVDSTFTGIPRRTDDDDESSWSERTLLQQPVGSIVFSTPAMNYSLGAMMAGGCVDDTCDTLLIEQPMEFVPHEAAMAVMQGASQVEPIPYHHHHHHPPGGHHAAMPPLPPPVHGGYWSNPAARHGMSALAVDWEALEFGEEELDDTERASSLPHPTMDETDEVMYHV